MMRNKLAVVLNLLEDEHRLKPLTDHRPIATLPFAARYRLIDFILSSMQNAELVSAAIFIGGSGHSLYDHIRSGYVWGLDSNVSGGLFTHSHVREKLGNPTGGNEALNYYENHRQYIRKSNAEKVLMAGTQMLTNVNLDALLQHHEEKESPVTVVFKNVSRGDLTHETCVNEFQIDGEQAEDVVSLSPVRAEADVDPEEKIAAGLKMLMIEREFIEEFLDYAEEQGVELNEETIVQYALDKGIHVNAFEYTGYFKAIEDVKGFYDANMDMLDERNFNSLYYRNSPVITRNHHSAPTYFGEDTDIRCSQIGSGCEIKGKCYESIIFRAVTIQENTTIDHSIVMSGSEIGSDVTLKYVIVDKDVTIDRGVYLEGTPDEPIVLKKGQHVTVE